MKFTFTSPAGEAIFPRELTGEEAVCTPLSGVTFASAYTYHGTE